MSKPTVPEGEAVAMRITSTDLHDNALRDLGAFVHHTVVEDEHTYAIRIDDGVLLDGGDQIEHARLHLGADGQRQIAALLACKTDQLDRELDTLAARDRTRTLKVRITSDTRDRARNGRFAFVHDRGRDFAAAIWVVDPLHHRPRPPGTQRRGVGAGTGGGLPRRRSPRGRRTARRSSRRRAAPGTSPCRHAEATRSNLGLGHDIRAGLLQPTEAQLQALRQIVCRLLVRHYGQLIAYGAGWTDPERQQPVGDTGRHEPRHPDRIVADELQRALKDPDPLRGITQLAARLGAAFTLDPDGVTRTKTLGTERMAEAPRRPARRRGRTAGERLGADAADAVARARRAQPRRVRHSG